MVRFAGSGGRETPDEQILVWGARLCLRPTHPDAADTDRPDPGGPGETPVRSLRLVGLEAAACEQLLAEHEVMGSPQERARLGEVYAGNPLALGIVAETTADLFGGQIDPFLGGR